MSRFRGEILDWLESGRIAAGGERAALVAAGMLPTRGDWRLFLGRLTLWLGTLALASAVVFFFAFNWDALGRFAKFGLVEGAMIAGLLLFLRVNLDSMAGKALLTLLSLLAGALLALTGQVYQTGADTYELFAWWAALILPWVAVSRFSPLWLLWLALLNLAVLLYFQRGWDGEGLLWALFGLDTLALLLWEAAHRRGIPWLRDSWPPRLVAVASGVAATSLLVWAIMDGEEGAHRPLAALTYFAWLGALYAWYRHVRPDLFMLAGGVLSATVGTVFFLSNQMLRGDGGSFLFIGLVVIGMSAGGAYWLRSVAQEQGA